MDYLLFENYQKTNKTLSDQIALLSQANLQAKVYVNSYMAVHDVCFGLIHFLAHKPKVSVIRLGSSLPESLLPHFYRLQTPISFKKENETNLQFLNSFDHEMNFTLWSAENEITGEILMSTASRQEIHKTLSSKRIYSIEIKSYFDDSDIETLKSNPYAILVIAGGLFHSGYSLVLATDKLKTPPLVGHFQEIKADLCHGLLKTQSVKTSDSFFDKNGLNYFSKFVSGLGQLNDRIVIYSKTVSGSALKSSLNLNDQEAFAASDLPSWVIEQFANWWPEAKQKDLLRGLLVIARKANVNDSFIQKLEKNHDQLTEQSEWSI